jgi:hypothetical protein
MAISVEVPRNDTQPIRVVFASSMADARPGRHRTNKLEAGRKQKRDQRLKFSWRTRRVEHPVLADLVADCDVVQRFWIETMWLAGVRIP